MQGSLQFAGKLISMRQKKDEELAVVNMFDISGNFIIREEAINVWKLFHKKKST